MLSQAEQVELKKDIISYIEGLGVLVFEIKLSYYRSSLVIKILADYKKGGISLDDCSQMNRKLCSYLDKYAGVGENYILEISSPGIDRAFSHIKDFIRAKGNSIDMWLNSEFEGKTHYAGRIINVDIEKGLIALETTNKLMNIPVNIIHKAKQKIT